MHGGSCDADKLLAAAYATAGDRRKTLALHVWRIRATGSLSGTNELVAGLGAMLRDESRRGKNRSRQQVLTWPAAQVLAIQTLDWWRSPVCKHCDGLGHPRMANAPVLDLTRDCPHCHGTGQTPLERHVGAEHTDRARWIVGELEGLSALIFYDMTRLLRINLDP
jgi:hypothetical protein